MLNKDQQALIIKYTNNVLDKWVTDENGIEVAYLKSGHHWQPLLANTLCDAQHQAQFLEKGFNVKIDYDVSPVQYKIVNTFNMADGSVKYIETVVYANSDIDADYRQGVCMCVYQFLSEIEALTTSYWITVLNNMVLGDASRKEIANFYSLLHGLGKLERLEQIEEIISHLNTDTLSKSAIVAVLRGCYMYKAELPSWFTLRDAIVDRFTREGGDDLKLLHGLRDCQPDSPDDGLSLRQSLAVLQGASCVKIAS